MYHDEGQFNIMDWSDYSQQDNVDEDEFCDCGDYKFMDLDVCALCCQGINCSRCGEDLIEDTLICEICSFDPEEESHTPPRSMKRVKRYIFLPFQAEIPDIFNNNLPKQTMSCA